MSKTYPELFRFERGEDEKILGIYFSEESISTSKLVISKSTSNTITLVTEDQVTPFELIVSDMVRWGRIVIPENYELTDKACVLLFDCNLEIVMPQAAPYFLDGIYYIDVYTDVVGIRRRHAISNILKD